MITKGTLVCKSKPFVHVVASNYRESNCDFCLKRNGNLRKCTSCSFTYYCNKKCQKKGWIKYHRHECLCIKKMSSAGLTRSDDLILISRIIYKLKFKDEDDEQVEKIGEITRSFNDLESHSKSIKKDYIRFKDVKTLAALLRDFLPPEDLPPFSEILEIFGKCQINGEFIRDNDFRTIATAVYLGASIFDHSCRPNAVMVPDGINGCVYLIEDIPDLDYSKIFIPYVDIRATTQERRTELKRIYYFDCNCERCLDVENDELLTSFKCDTPNCDEPIIISTSMICRKCNKLLSDNKILKSFNIMELCQQFRTKLDQLSNFNRFGFVLSACEEIINEAKPLLHPLNIHYIRIVELAYYACVNLCFVPGALQLAKILLPTLIRYCGKFYPPVGILMLRMGKASLFLNEREDAQIYLAEGFEILSVTRGLSDEGLNPYRDLLWMLDIGQNHRG